jgi:hypothetical protein
MKISIAGAAVAGIVGALVAVLVMASGVISPHGNKKDDWGLILIQPNGSACQVSTTPSTLHVSKNGKVDWIILNACDKTLGTDVEIKFKASDPLDPNCTRKGKYRISCDVDSKSAPGTYSYSVIAGDFREDPDLEIAP